jgi:phosphoglycolate phosphatase-like HAD superfamily hydrolase
MIGFRREMPLITETQVIHKLIESKELLIFDFDGVLADSVEVKTDAFSKLYKSYGEDVVSKVVNHHRMNGGMSRFEKFKYYHHAYLGLTIDDKQLLELSEQFSALVINAVIASFEVPGVTFFLQNYCVNNKKCIINSATPQDEIYQIVEERGMIQYFSNIYGSPSTKYENLNLALSDHHLGNKEALFFGDADSDLKASYRANVDFIGVGNVMNSLLSNSSGRHYHIKDFRDINDEIAEIQQVSFE